MRWRCAITDQNQNDKHAEDKFKEVSEAYTMLSDPEKRARYDRLGHLGLSIARCVGHRSTVRRFGIDEVACGATCSATSSAAKKAKGAIFVTTSISRSARAAHGY